MHPISEYKYFTMFRKYIQSTLSKALPHPTLLSYSTDILCGSEELGQNVWERRLHRFLFWKYKTFTGQTQRGSVTILDGEEWRQFPVNWDGHHVPVWLMTLFWKIEAQSRCTLEKIAIGVTVEDLKSRNTSISQWASAVRSGGGVLSGTRGLRQPPTSCFPCLWQLTRERLSVHPEWLFQPPHLDAGAELELKWIDSLFHPPFINSQGLEVQWSSSLDYFSPEEVAAIAKVSVTVLPRFPYKESHMIFCASLFDYVLGKCVCASAVAMDLTGVPHHVIRVSLHQFFS